MDSSVLRFDFSPITGTETTDEGYLRVWARTARTGIQLYRRADGSQVREYRPPEEVTKPESLATFGMKPVTLEHPPVLLDSNNTTEFQKGYSGSQVRFTDGFVEVALVVTDEGTIKSIQRGDSQEVSAGYRVDYDPTPGITPEGESYDGVQRNIRVNHIAIVRKGRAGPEVRLLLDRMDSDAAVAVPESSPSLHKPTSSPPMASVNLDGLEIDLPAEAATAVQSFSRDMNRQLAAVKGENEDLKAKLDSLQADLNEALEQKEAAEGRADAYEARLDSLDEDSSSGRLDTAEIDKLVQARLTTLQTLAPAFADDFKFDGIEDTDLYSQAFTNLTGKEPPEGASHDYIAGVVEGILAARSDSEDEEGEEEEGEGEDEEEDLPPRSDSADNLRTQLRGAGTPKKSPSEMQRARLEEGWKAPLTANATR